MMNPFGNGSNQPNIMDVIMQRFGNIQNFSNQANTMLNQFNQQGIDPQQKVQELLNSRQMTQEQFNMLRGIVNSITGKNL